MITPIRSAPRSSPDAASNSFGYAIVGPMKSRDTTAAAASLHDEACRQLGIAGRLRIALELSDLTHAFAIAGMKRRFPECSDEDARRRLAELLYSSTDARTG